MHSAPSSRGSIWSRSRSTDNWPSTPPFLVKPPMVPRGVYALLVYSVDLTPATPRPNLSHVHSRPNATCLVRFLNTSRHASCAFVSSPRKEKKRINIFVSEIESSFTMTTYTPPENWSSVSGKTIIITGCASGIGKETALLAFRNGANLVLADWDEKNGKTLVEELGDER